MRLLFIYIFVLSVSVLSCQEESPILFIGDSFFKNNYLLDKVRNNYLKIYDAYPSLDSSLINGMSCIRQIRSNEMLRIKLQKNEFRYIVLQSPSLLEPGIYNEMYDVINELLVLCPQVEKVILVTLNECTSFPKYECANFNNEIECNIYQNCNAEHDTIKTVAFRLAERLELLEVLPFSRLKRKMEKLSFLKKDDIYGHPSEEIQELLARCFVIWISKDSLEFKDEIFIQKLTDRVRSLSEKDSEEIIKSFLGMVK